MYLKVQIPYVYSLSKSESDPTQWEVLPHRSQRLKTHHIFCDLLSYQTPWSQFNKKGEIYTIDNAYTLYPAFCKTTKIRPKMLPSSGKINLFNLSELGGLRKYAPQRELLISNGTPKYSTWKTQDNETAENEYYSKLQTIPANIYSKVYEKFFTTRTKPVHKFMEWVSTQKDIVGVWNANSISSELLNDRGGVNYRYSNYQAFGSKQVASPTPRKLSSKPYLQAMLGRSDEFTDTADYSSLVVDYDQKMWGCVPYESHPEFNLPRQAVTTDIGYETDIQVKKTIMAHGEVSSYHRQSPRNTDFAPPILDWESVGFPKVSPVSTKALYARKPIHLQFVYRETGFVSRKKINNSDSDSLLNQIISDSVNYSNWFKRLALPVDTSQDQVSNYRVIEGSVRSVSSMSHNTLKFSEGSGNNRTMVGEHVGYESTGNAYCFSLSSYFSGANRNLHFPRGDYTTVGGKIISEKDTPIPHSLYPELGGRYYPKNQKYFPLQRSSSSTQEGRVVNINRISDYRPTLGTLTSSKNRLDYTPVDLYEMLNDSVTYPRFSYSAKTQAYHSRAFALRSESHNSGLRTTSFRPLDVLDPDQDLEGMKILNKIMLENLIPNETIFNDSGNGKERPRKDDTSLFIPFTRLVDMINLAQMGMASDYTPIKVEAVPVKVGQAVKLTQNLSLAAFSTFSSPLSELSSAQQKLLVDFVKTIENTRTITGDDIPLEYSVTLYINPKNDLSVLVDYPSILMRDMGRGRWRDSLVPAFRIIDLVDILTDKTYSQTIFHSESPPYFLILPEGRYGATEGVIKLCSTEDYRELTQTSGVWGDDLEYITRPFTLNTVFNDYCYHTIHIKSGMTVSDPVNTLPLDLKRNKLTVKRPFTYTSIFPVTGELKDVELSLSLVKRPFQVGDGVIPTSFGYSPVAYYSVPKDSEEMPDNIPQNMFKPMNTNGRTFKGQRNRSYGAMTKAKDYTTYSSIVLPFENINYPIREAESHPDIFSKIVDNNPETPLLMPFLKEQRNPDSRSARYKYLSDNLSSWSLGVPAEFVPETYSLTGMELGLFNWPFGLV